MANIKNIVMLGFSDMGKGIAQICLMAGDNVTAVDISEDLIENEKKMNLIKSNFR